MKKILVVGLISSFFSAGAFAAACTATATTSAQAGAAGSATAPTTGEQCVCDGGTAFKNTVNGGASNATITTPIFVQRGFDVQCSANTIVSYNEVSPTGFAVGSGSRKGNRMFKGSTAGGGIAEAGTCATTGCTGANVTTANAAATTDSSS